MNRVLTIESICKEEGRQEGRQEGIQEGMEKGMEKGVKKGEFTIVESLLKLKFGTLSAEYKKKLEIADAETLLTFASRVLTANTIEDVFK